MPNRTDRIDLSSAHAGGRIVAVGEGDRILIRQVCPEDKQKLLDGLMRLSPESRYRRFFSPMPTLSEDQLRYLTELDHTTHEALMAEDPRTGDGVGVARFIRADTDPRIAEVAVAVVDDWQGGGVGTALLEALTDRAREEGIRRLSASVLASNTRMLGLLREVGDTTVVDRSDGVVELQIQLRGPRMTPIGLFHALRAAARGELTLNPWHRAAPD